MAIVKVPVYLKLKNVDGRVMPVGSFSGPVGILPDEKLLFFEIEVDNEWISPAIQTGITMQVGIAGILDPKLVVRGLRGIQREMQQIDPT